MERFSTAILSGERRWEFFCSDYRPLFNNVQLDFKKIEPPLPIGDTNLWIEMNFYSLFFSAARKVFICEELFLSYKRDAINQCFDVDSSIAIKFNHDLIRMAVIELANFRDAMNFYLLNGHLIKEVFDLNFVFVKEARDAIAHAAERRIGFALVPTKRNRKISRLNIKEQALFTKTTGSSYEFLHYDGSKQCLDLRSEKFEQFVIDAGKLC